mmetsp:Transcript_2805/g.7548  ORF Transcript_2805/g.7548 Transcript_2805/m.7548 type:complete len:446 (-) Transcript_2805:594-1931(-)
MRSKTYTKQTAQANVKGNTHRENVQKSTRRENAQGKCAGTTKIRTNPTRFPNTCTLPSEPNLTWLPAHASQTNASLRPHSLRQVLLMTSDEVAELEAEYVAHGGEAAEAAAAAVTAARMGGSGAATGAGGRGSKARRQDKQGVSEAAPAAGAAGSPGGGGGGGPGSSSLPTPSSALTLCEDCHRDEVRRFGERGAHIRLPPGISPDRLVFVKLEPDAPHIADTDPQLECEHLVTRQSFLNLCQGNHYQFDTVRRAKHSSMMVLYHLHNPDAPAFALSCNVCSAEMEAGTGFRCTVCRDFDICAGCKQSVGHPHALESHVQRLDETRTRLTEQQRRERAEQLKRTMQLLVHACSCSNPACDSHSCRKVRLLFQHASQCQTKVQGGCATCRKIWSLLNIHARSCTTAACPVPRCRDLKEVRRRQASRQEDQRRKAYASMLRTQQQQV